MPAGRQSIRTDAIVDLILTRIAAGESLVQITKEKDMPSYRAVLAWLASDEDLQRSYARAREDQADTLADEIVGIADSATPEDFQVKRLQVDARKWVASKLGAKKYGDKAGDINVNTINNTVVVMSEERRAALSERLKEIRATEVKQLPVAAGKVE